MILRLTANPALHFAGGVALGAAGVVVAASMAREGGPLCALRRAVERRGTEGFAPPAASPPQYPPASGPDA